MTPVSSATLSLSHAAEVVGHGHRGGDAPSEAAESAAPAASAAEPVQPARQAADSGVLLYGEALHGELWAETPLHSVLNMAFASVVALTSSSLNSEMNNEEMKSFSLVLFIF